MSQGSGQPEHWVQLARQAQLELAEKLLLCLPVDSVLARRGFPAQADPAAQERFVFQPAELAQWRALKLESGLMMQAPFLAIGSAPFEVAVHHEAR